MVCGITADADNKDAAISAIDHAANSKKCDGKDENCVWYPNGVPDYVPDEDIDPKRTIQGLEQSQELETSAAKIIAKQSARKKSRK